MTNVRELLSELNHGLRGLYGGRLRGTYLYGSYARGEQQQYSDVDVLILLDRVDSYGGEILRTEALVSDVSLKYGASVSRVFFSERDWAALDSPFLDAVRREAVAA